MYFSERLWRRWTSFPSKSCTSNCG
jgi:hypothetical protein